LIFSSIAILVLAEPAARLWDEDLREAMSFLGCTILISTFLFQVLLFLLTSLRSLILSLTDFFSSQKSLQRSLLFNENNRLQLEKLYTFKLQHTDYFRQQKIKQLLNRNNQLQIRSLVQSLQEDILAIKKYLSPEVFKQLQQEIIRYQKNQNVEALIRLQHRILTGMTHV